MKTQLFQKKMKIKKGEYQYITSKRKATIFRTFALFLVSAIIFIMGIITTGDKNNLLTIVAVLGMLPASKSVVEMIMYIKAKDITGKDYEKIAAEVAPFPILYSLYLTSEKKNFALDAMFVINDCLIAYTSDAKMDVDAAKKHIMSYLKKDGKAPNNLQIFTEIDKFIGSIRSNKGYIQSEKEQQMEYIVTLLSL